MAIWAISLGFIYITPFGEVISFFFPNRAITGSCDVGECVVDIRTGKKTCDFENGPMEYNMETEICSLPHECNSQSILPYAELPDGGTISNPLHPKFGMCFDNQECRCLEFPYCSSSAISYYVWDKSSGKYIEHSYEGGPLEEPGTEMCSFPYYFIPRVTCSSNTFRPNPYSGELECILP